jgi:hypothetical protein
VLCCSQLLCAALHCIELHCTILLLVTNLVVRAGVPILMPPGVIADTSPGMVFCKWRDATDKSRSKENDARRIVVSCAGNHGFDGC